MNDYRLVRWDGCVYRCRDGQPEMYDPARSPALAPHDGFVPSMGFQEARAIVTGLRDRLALWEAYLDLEAHPMEEVPEPDAPGWMLPVGTDEARP